MTKITKRGVALLVAVAAAVLAVVAGPRTPHIDGNTSGDADLAARVRSLLPDLTWLMFGVFGVGGGVG